uniref:E3 ubiquitin-protein ligase UBR5 n=1 Tax=Aceria tosichella TaxID=561515 RepID=A0A6G1SD51_9ACAR
MSNSMKLVVTPLPVSDDTLFDCIKDAVTRPTRSISSVAANPISGVTTSSLTAANFAPAQPSHATQFANTITNNQPCSVTQQQASQSQPSNSPHITNINATRSLPISQIVVGPRHVGVLLEDGRVYRAPYQVQADRLEFPPAAIATPHTTAQICSMSAAATSVPSSSANLSHSHGSSQLQAQHSHGGSSSSATSSGSQLNSISKPQLSGNAIGNQSSIAGVISPPGGLDARSGTSGSSNPGSSGPPSGVPNVPPFSTSRVNISPQVGSLSSVQHRSVSRRGRMFRHTAARGRGASVIMSGGRGVIPAQYVPEDLINQAQVVLQGKPRSAIVRELQRTNLDVNSAVNNLLSSDNEDPEDMDESQDYLPNEDLMSLLDSSVGLPSGPASVLIDAETVFPEDVFYHNPSGSRMTRSNFRHTVAPGRNNSERESSLASELEVRRMSGRDPSQSRRWLEHALRDPQNSDSSSNNKNSATPTDFTLHQKNEPNHSASNTKKVSSTPEINPIQISESIEFWPTNSDRRFVQIACMHSELIAISNTGQIHQWKWSEPMPFEGIRHGDLVSYHPRAAQLGLINERVLMISASCIRATVVTESSKVATWIDETISCVASKLEHSAQNYPEFQKGDKIAQLQTCSLYTCIRLESGSMYWWGVAPFSQRKKNWKKIQSKTSKHGSSGSSNNEIGVGSIVCLKNGPSFGDGAIGFTTKDGVPRVGRLTMSAWNITDTCTFKMIQSNDRRVNQTYQLSDTKNSSQRIKKMLGNQPIDFSGNVSDPDLQAPSSPVTSKSISATTTTAPLSAPERIEMPPPPSPASSTCSEPGCSPSHKRKHKHLISLKEDDRLKDEEQWNLKDVIFLEEVKKPPAAKVIKLDGNTALVRFNQRDPFGNQSDSDVNAYLQDCRMIRKDELQLAKETTSSSRIIDCQRSPKKINIADSRSFLTFTVSNNGIHALVKNGTKIEYKMYQLASGKISKSLFFPTDTNAFLGRDPSLISLYASGESDVAVTLRDGNGSLYPLARDFHDSLREPQPLDMPPVQAIGMAVHPARDPNYPNRTYPTLVMAAALENQILMPAVLKSDPELVRLTLASLDQQPVSQQIVASEKIDLNRNVLHAAVYSCAPTPSRGSTQERGPLRSGEDSFDPTISKISSVINETIRRTRIKRESSSGLQQSSLDLSSDSSQSRVNQQMPDQSSVMDPSVKLEASSTADWTNTILNKIEIDPSEQKQSAHSVLLILVECPFLRPFLRDLMVQRDAHGMTPFMSAVSSRAYTAALILLDLAQWIIKQEEITEPDLKLKSLYSMIFPPGTNLDNNPLYMLCANDTCSFTWTGAQHINQDIFECKTCGLTKTLCCCTECARTCHKGHDCRLKKTSPTAYCDCWEKCKCKSLVAGSHFTRFKLLERLLAETDLVTYPGSKGESILLFLVQTVGRQIIEQRQYGPDRTSRHNKRDDPVDMPDHDLSPPRFARKALHKLLGEWLALKTVIMSGTGSAHNLANAARCTNNLLNVEDQMFLSGQQGTALLDRFTHSLLIKIGPEMLDVLLSTIIRESSSSNANRVYEARLVAKRFVRSVARNGVVLSVELSPINYSHQPYPADLTSSIFSAQINSGPYGSSNTSQMNSSSWKASQQPASILQKCRKVFQALLPIAAEELAEIADALISPVRLGVPRPTAPFSLVNSMAEATQGSEEIFVVDPVVLPTNPSVDNVATASQPVIRPGLSSSQSTSTTVRGPGTSDGSQDAISMPDRMRLNLYIENDLAMDGMDSEDAEASNNTFRRSNNGETDSDSDSNLDDASIQSNMEPSGTRSTATGATVGSEIGASTVAYFSEPESGDSSNVDEDEESEANDTEHDNDDIAFSHEENFAFSRRSNITNAPSNSSDQVGHAHSQAIRSNLGQQLHWALRHRDHSFYPHQPTSMMPTTAARLASMGLVNYTYMDGAPNRRSVMTAPSSSNNISGGNNELSMSTTAVGLSRAFSIIIRSISDLIPILKESERSDSALTINQLKVSPTDAATIICNLEKKLNPVWEWLFKVMDSTEGQLRFGCALTNGIQAVASQTVANQQSSQNVNTNQRGLSNISGPVALSPSLINSVIAQQQSAPYTLPVTPAILARINSSLAAHQNISNMSRRMSNLFDDARAHGSAGLGTSPANPSDPPGVRLHNPISNQGPGVSRPQSLNVRSNLDAPAYVRVPLAPGSSDNVVDGTAARRDFLSYMISLIRGHGNEHHDSLPILDVSSLRHVAYVFDAYVYYLRALNHHKLSKAVDDGGIDDEDLTVLLSEQNQGSRHQFFQRSESTLFLDGVAPDPFSQPLSEALPLAEQPHLLQPNSRREDLFGISKSISSDCNPSSLPLSLSSASANSCANCFAQQQKILTQNILDSANFNLTTNPAAIDRESMLCPIHKRSASDGTMKSSSDIQHTALLGRWKLTVELFGREFLDDVGAEPGSILTDLVGFPLKENRFRREMERLRSDSAPRDISLTNIDRDKNILIRQTIKELNNVYHLAERNQGRRNMDLPLLACSKVKVSFKDEKGEGNGVARSFYTAFCEAVLSNEKLANLDAPLFYQPGLRNFYSPRQGDPTPDRLNAFRNVGRVIGICLSQSEICPIQLNRHVIKYFLRKPISWHDLAFFDPILYESLRQLVLDAEMNAADTTASALHALDLRFCVDLSVEEGGTQQVELAPGGRDIEVTTSNIYEYVRRYALKRMLKSQEKALQAMRQGVMDVLPPTALDNLTAEDFRLLLNGVGEINIQTLIGYTTFIDDRGTSASKRSSVHVDEQLGYFKKWFWSIVEKMTTKERQDLVYFWTGSPSLPASEEGFQPMPTVSIRPAEDLHLPTSNVCIFRLYIPLYSSKTILRSKLLTAIKEKNFGFI